MVNYDKINTKIPDKITVFLLSVSHQWGSPVLVSIIAACIK